MDKYNFDEEAVKSLNELAKNENWTWSGFAEALAGHFGKVDLEELVDCLNVEIFKKAV